MTQRHFWKPVDGDRYHQRCFHCGMERRRAVIDTGDVNPARHSYRVWEYRPKGKELWRWVRQRQRVPGCYWLPPIKKEEE